MQKPLRSQQKSRDDAPGPRRGDAAFSRSRTPAAVCAAAVLVVGTAGVTGWLFNLERLPSILLGFVRLEATTALAFVVAALALWLSSRRPSGRLAPLLALAVGVLGALNLFEFAAGVDLGLGLSMVRPLDVPASDFLPDRMPVATAVCFVVFALGVVSVRREHSWVAGFSAVVFGGVAGVAAVGYAYELSGLDGDRPFSSMALPTALAFLLLAVGLPFIRPEHGLVGFANGDGAGPALVRRLVPWAVAVPVGAGWLLLAGERSGLYAPQIATALLVLTTVGLLVAVIAWTAHGLAAAEERRQHERVEAEGRFRVAVEASPSGMLMVDEQGSIVLADSQVVHLFGYEGDELVGRGVEELVPQRYRDAHRELLATFYDKPSARPTGAGRELFGLRKDGTEFPLELALYPVPTPSGTMILGSIVDITERRQQEQERASLQRQLLQAQKLESVGRLAGGVAHDFNNILGVLGGYAELLRDGLGDEPVLAAHAGEILMAVDRASGLTRQLLAFSRLQVLQPTVVDVNEVVRGVEGMLRRLIRADVEMVTQLEENVSSVRADAGQLEQVLMNLAVNARDAMPRGGRLTIETASVVLDESYAALHPDVRPGPQVQLSVSDTGVGMDEETLQQVFDPFFTTKPKGQGTGLGLATVHGIVRQSAGHVYAYSEPGKGTTFKVYLPAVDAAPRGERPVVHEGPPTGSETILVVEDEEALCAVARTGLEAYGYAVLTASRGRVALEISDGYEGPIDLLLTDVVMPDVGGRELAADLCARRPGLRVLYMSGYTDDVVIRHGILEQRTPFIQKPFTLTALARRVRRALDDPAAAR